jgi:hypothetical protein
MKAFPNGIITNKDGLIVGGQNGMDLRDYFAAKAMQGMFANSATKQVERTDLPIFAKVCYEMADAMMEARNK